MAKRFAIGLILLSMMVHSASRLGVISYLYEHRHEIAYTVGLINEIPIATCSASYDFTPGLEIISAEDADASLPPAIVSANEIILFFDGNSPFDLETVIQRTRCAPSTSVVESWYSTPTQSIFHPPTLS